MHQVDLIRRYTIRKLKELRIYISCLPVREDEALKRLSGMQGERTAAIITDHVLTQLGHTPSVLTNGSQTARAARKQM